MEYQTRRRRLLGTLLIIACLLALFPSVIAFNIGGARSFLMAFWAGPISQWEQVKPTEIWMATNGSLTLLVLLVGGWAGYLRFIRRREMHASCSLTLKAELVPIGDGHAIKVVATVLNAGSYQLVFSNKTQQYVDMQSADRVMWDDVLLHGGQMIWSMGATQTQVLLETEGVRRPPDYLEPGQQLERTLLFPVLANAIAFNIQMYVEACPRWIATDRPKQGWSTELILTAKETPAETRGHENGR